VPADSEGIEEALQNDTPVDADNGGGLRQAVLARYEALDYAGALGELWGWIGQLNQRIVARAPWELAKDATRQDELEALLYRLLEALRLVALLVWPVMPRAAARLLSMLGVDEPEPGARALAWGLLAPGALLGTVEPLFPRIQVGKDDRK